MRRTRPLWRTLIDLLVFLVVLGFVLRGLDIIGSFDVGRGNASAMDGDSLRLNQTEVRLFGIDAPELNQTCGSPDGEYPCGREAHTALRGLLRGRTISCTGKDRDRYGRTVSICRDGDLEINSEMVRQGWAVALMGSRTDGGYSWIEAEARRAKRGIWRGKFQLPENYRAANRKTLGGAAADD